MEGVSLIYTMEMKTCKGNIDAVEDLYALHLALREYLREIRWDDNDRDNLQDAVGAYDPEMFQRTREWIFLRIESLRTALRLHLYQYDIQATSGTCWPRYVHMCHASNMLAAPSDRVESKHFDLALRMCYSNAGYSL